MRRTPRGTLPHRCWQADRSVLLDVPEHHRIRSLDHILEARPHRRRTLPHTPGDVDHILVGEDLDLLRDLLTRFPGGGERPLAAQLLELLIAAPTPPGFVTAR